MIDITLLTTGLCTGMHLTLGSRLRTLRRPRGAQFCSVERNYHQTRRFCVPFKDGAPIHLDSGIVQQSLDPSAKSDLASEQDTSASEISDFTVTELDTMHKAAASIPQGTPLIDFEFSRK